MPVLIPGPSVIEAVGHPPKRIEEFVGLARTGESRLSIARMDSPEGWSEPGQRPDFDEITLVIDGCLVAEHEGGVMEVRSGQAVVAHAGEWVRYSSPHPGGARYIAVCLPAFSPEAVHRDA